MIRFVLFLHDTFIDFYITFCLLWHSYLYYWQSWKSIPDFTASAETPPLKFPLSSLQGMKRKISVFYLQALQEQTYPKEFFEIIVVDDHSTDATAEIVMQISGCKIDETGR